MKLLASLRPETRLGRPVALTTLFAFLIATIPGPALASAVEPIERFSASLDERPEGYGLAMPKSRLLTAAMMAKAQGRTGENPYLAGQSKWDVMYKGVDLMTGNYSASASDLTFEGGYGIPVNVTRSYSANNPDEGPLGKGWTLSVDVRSTAGGLSKGAGVPVRAVPTGFKNRPSTQSDPNAELGTGQRAQPVEAVIATDAGGTEETVQIDADGVLTTPPWDKNTNETTYDNVVQSDGSVLRRTLTNKTFTPDGATYVYQRLGTYPYGTRPWNNPNAASEPSDVMKIVSATDRQGNVTTYSYGADVSFQKANGLVTESRLTKIQMPNGHHIDFGWTNLGTAGNPVWRMTGASDGLRTVQYAYGTATQERYCLTGVTTPGGKTTTYGYGVTTDNYDQNGNSIAGADSILKSITDPRGLQTQILSSVSGVTVSPYETPAGLGVVAQYLVNSNSGGTKLSCSIHGGNAGPWVESEVTEYQAGTWNGSGFSGDWVNRIHVRIGGGATPYVVERVNRLWTPNTTGTAETWKDFDPTSQNLMRQVKNTYRPSDTYDGPGSQYRLALARGLSPTTNFMSYSGTSAESTTTYNFMGNPLSKTVREYPQLYGGTSTRESKVEYAYWGADRYWQQKAVRDEGAAFGSDDRISFTDYYTATDAAGSRGQTRKVYDAKNTPYVIDPTILLPPTVDPNGANVWKYRLRPATDTHAAEFTYDAKGRPTDVWKLQSTATSPWTYVQIHTAYGTDTDGSWGQASSMIEDYGGANRTTATLHYDAIGRADRSQDAKGEIIATHYDLDGVVQGVDRIVGGVASPVITYTYGSSGLTNGQVLSVKDELSGVLQTFGYCPTGNGLGQVSGVVESGGPNPSYSTGYSYNTAGDRDTETIVTPNGTTKWGYEDYITLGSVSSPVRVFQTMVRLDPTSGARTKEEFHYFYSSTGQLLEAAFDQTPSATSASTRGWYRDSSGNPISAASRARAHYEYDAGGRLKLIAHWWDQLQNGQYVSTPILANECDYELTGLNRGLKTASRFYRGNAAGTAWNLERTESYGYDAANDQLTNANYGDAGANAVQSWSYDAAGNRTSDSSNPGNWSYDNLNRILTSPQGSYTHDVLGNRLTAPGGTNHTWDALGRMTSYGTGSSGPAMALPHHYIYRADGMRVSKDDGELAGPRQGGGFGGLHEVYRYDGQMPVETVEMEGPVTNTIERHALGARGTDMIERTTSSGTQTRFPLYDAHGNSVATLGRPSGSGLPSLGDERSYDAWGRVRIGLQTGAPSARYCASLGHVQDDESGLVYMRARYYEPWTGRFVSQDPARKGANWYSYCQGDPINKVDPSGNTSLGEVSEAIGTGEGLDAEGGGGAMQFEQYFVNALGRYTGSHQAEIAIELLESEEIDAMGGGAFKIASLTRELAKIVIYLTPAGMRSDTLCHEVGESLMMCVQRVFGDSFAMGHDEAEAIVREAWKFFMG